MFQFTRAPAEKVNPKNYLELPTHFLEQAKFGVATFQEGEVHFLWHHTPDNLPLLMSGVERWLESTQFHYPGEVIPVYLEHDGITEVEARRYREKYANWLSPTGIDDTSIDNAIKASKKEEFINFEIVSLLREFSRTRGIFFSPEILEGPTAEELRYSEELNEARLAAGRSFNDLLKGTPMNRNQSRPSVVVSELIDATKHLFSVSGDCLRCRNEAMRKRLNGIPATASSFSQRFVILGVMHLGLSLSASAKESDVALCILDNAARGTVLSALSTLPHLDWSEKGAMLASLGHAFSKQELLSFVLEGHVTPLLKRFLSTSADYLDIGKREILAKQYTELVTKEILDPDTISAIFTKAASRMLRQKNPASPVSMERFIFDELDQALQAKFQPFVHPFAFIERLERDRKRIVHPDSETT